MPKQPAYTIAVADPSKPERSLTPSKILAAVEPPAKGQRIYWVKGTGLPVGLGLLVRPLTATHSTLNATWVVQANDPNEKSVRQKIARFGDVPVKDVLTQAVELRQMIQAGTHRQRKEVAKATADRNAFTVGDAFRLWVEHLELHARPSTVRNAVGKEGTADDVTAGKLRSGWIKQHFGELLDRPLAIVTKLELRNLHVQITKKSGAATANRVMRAFRAVWNQALELYEDLPRNLLAGTKRQRGFAWNDEKEGGELIPFHELSSWWAEVHELPPVRRDWNLFALFTAARRDDCKTLRWEHVDLERGTVHFPEPKGGPKKAYTIPVAAIVVDLLRRRQAENSLQFGDDRGWVFPIRHRTEGVTHIRQPAEMRYVEGKKVRVLPSPHMLRRTWITAADGLITAKQSMILANHGGERNVHSRYQIPDENALRAAAEKVASFLLTQAGVVATIHATNARSSVG